MIDRREFVGGVLGLALTGRSASKSAAGYAAADNAALRQYLVDLTACNMNTLGVPGRQSLVQEGLHPIAPERMIVVNNNEIRRLRNRRRELKQQLCAEENRWRNRFPDESLPVGKLDVVVGLMDRLTSHYRRPDLLEKWSLTLWRRELLGSTGIGNGLGLLHDFQSYNTPVRTDNGRVDWWLVLFPGGVEWQAPDGQPVHIMVGPVMEEENRPGWYMRVMEGISRGLRSLTASEGFDPSTWAIQLAGMPTDDAAREFNFAVVQGLSRKK